MYNNIYLIFIYKILTFRFDITAQKWISSVAFRANTHGNVVKYLAMSI